MFLAVVGVEDEHVLEGHGAAFGVEGGAGPGGVGEAAIEADDAFVDAFEDSEGGFDGLGGGVGQFRPIVLAIGLEGRVVFGDDEVGADKHLHVGVGEVVDDLEAGPPAVAVGAAELFIGGTGDQLAQLGGQSFEFGDERFAFRGSHGDGWTSCSSSVRQSQREW